MPVKSRAAARLNIRRRRTQIYAAIMSLAASRRAIARGLPGRLESQPRSNAFARDKIGARERQARFLGVLQKFSRALPFVIVPRASIGLRQYYCVARRLAAVAEEQAPQSIWLWRLAKPMQPSQRQRGAFETLPLRVGKTQPLAQARRVLG